MKEQLVFRRLLQKKYEELRFENPLFSRRAFSKSIGLSAGAISEIFNGQRHVSLKLAKRIVEKLGLDPQSRMEIFSAFEKHKKKPRRVRSKTIAAPDPEYLRLSADQFRVIGDWYHFAIWMLMKTSDFISDVTWISNRLGLNSAIVRAAIDRLKRLGLVSEDEYGNFTTSDPAVFTPDDVSNASLRLLHFELLQKSRTALETLPVEDRDFTGYMLNLNPSQLPRVKEKIRKFQDELSAEFESQPQPEVYQLCVQLFPLTRVRKDRREA